MSLSLSIVFFPSQNYKTLSLPFIPTNELWQCKYCRNIWWLRLYCTCISSLINTFNQQLLISVHVRTLKQSKKECKKYAEKNHWKGLFWLENLLGKKTDKNIEHAGEKLCFFFVKQVIILYRRMQARSPISLPSQYAFANG